MNAKKIIALLLALVLCVGTLAACNNDQPEQTTQATTKATEGTKATTQATEATQPSVEDVDQDNSEYYPIDFDGTLTLATTKSNADEAHNYLLMEELTGVDIEWMVMANEQVPLLFVGDAAKNLPDLFMNVGGITQSQIKEYGQAGLLVNFLDPEILDKMPNLKAAYEADPRMFDGVKDPNGAAYALPYYCYTLTMAGNLFYIRTDMTKEAGIEELPTTIEGFLEMCETLKTYYKDVEGYVPMVTNGGAGVKYNGAYTNFFFPAFGELLRPGFGISLDNTTVYCGYATEQYKHYLEFMNTCWEKGYLDPNAYSVDSNTDKAMLIDKKTTMNPFATYLGPNNFASGELDFQVMPPLTSEYQSEVQWLIPNRYRSAAYMISANCKDIDAACAFFDALYTTKENPIKDDGTVSAWGISLWLGECGEDFVLDEENGTYEITPDLTKYENASTFLSSAGHGGSAYLYWPYVENSGTGLMVKALGSRDILEPVGTADLDISLLILNQEELDDYNDLQNDVHTKVAEMTAAFITGQADLEKDWDAYVNDLYDMGLQTIIDNYLAALERYNAG